MYDRPAIRLGFLGLLAVCLAATPFHADTISVAWDALNDPTVTGYRVYYGTSVGNYSQTQDALGASQAVLSGLTSCTDYYVSVKAYNAEGTESIAFATEISGWPQPVVSSAAPQAVQRGSSIALILTGANYRSGVSVTSSNPGVSVNTVTAQGCNQLTLNVGVASNAALGPFDLSVTDANGIVGTGVGVAAVTADTTAPAITNVQSGAVGSTTATVFWTTDESADSQVFYRETGETVYQQTAVDTAWVPGHTITLTGLTPNSTYEYYVRSADSGGNSATANGPATIVTSSNSFTYLRFEPENGPISAPAESIDGSGAFANAWLQLQQGTSSGTVGSPSGSWDYGFSIPSSGSWYVWFRMYGVNANANAWFESVDGGSFSGIQPAQNGRWEWVEASSRSFSTGQHTLTLGGAEALARIDRVLITDDPAFLPTEQPASDVTPPAPVSALTATPDDAQVALAWTNPSDSDLDRVVVRYRTDGTTPSSPVDGQGALDRAAEPGTADGVTHTGLTNAVPLSYAVFAIDASGNVSPLAAIAATPDVQQAAPPEQVQNLHRTDN